MPVPQLTSLVEDLCSREHDESKLYERAVELIFETARSYDWVGIYRVEEDMLVLSAWKGPQATEHVRIPLDQGICGFAATSSQTVVVDDVNADPRYLACFPQTKSEIVVPISAGGEVVAEIDIDSDRVRAFDNLDREILERVADLIGKRVSELRS